ncbi:hypothetical protein V1514DRAFT_328666 [Lipomyces japonicus]|uniref:uncharacterized protein n=1 Tax=Lipomyces japonicus TaxID=56871 RepID=UPI0034CF5E63
MIIFFIAECIKVITCLVKIIDFFFLIVYFSIPSLITCTSSYNFNFVAAIDLFLTSIFSLFINHNVIFYLRQIIIYNNGQKEVVALE